MGITCPCCGLKFIVCAAHLTPDERTVQCLNCATRWPVPGDGAPAPRALPAVPQPTVPQSGAEVAAGTPAGHAGRLR
jgi:predicted Zn finger-like uncharacterized protein